MGTLSGGQVVNPAVTATSIAVTSVNPASEVYGLDSQVTITAVLSWTGSGPAPTASDVGIGGNGPSGYSATSCGSPSGDTLTCTATYTPTGADTVGSYTESASFSGDSNYSGSSSTQTNNFSITQASSSTSVGSGQNPSTVGQSVTFTATIDGEYGLIVRRNGALLGGGVSVIKRGTPQRGLTQKGQAHPLVLASGITGTVTWSANTGCSPTPVSGNPGTSQCTTSTLPQGTDTITASYGGDNNHTGSMGTLSGSQVVNPVQYQLTTQASPSADGTVTPTSGGDYASGASIPVAATANNGYQFNNWTSTGGTFDSTTVASTNFHMPSAATTVTANFIALTTTALVSSSTSNTSTYGDSVTFTATVTSSGSGTPNGTVNFENGTGSLVTIKLVGGSASLTTSALTAGSHTITAHYNGSTKYASSSSTALTQTVNKVGTTTTITNASPNPSTYGQPVTFTATVSTTAGSASGNVEFKAGTLRLGSGTLSGGSASYTTTATQIPGGQDAITAVYSGDANHAASPSTAYPQTVNKEATTTVVMTSGSPSNFGNLVTFTATVSASAGTPAGNVAFTDGTTLLGTMALSGGTAQFTTSALAVGTHTIHADYHGNGNYAVSSGQVTQVVQ
jgi:hypothetical protein